jgi:geranylgeranyl diphosphate synthase type II
MTRTLERYRALVEARLETYFTEDAAYQSLLEAMRYSVLAGGKRLRPVLSLAFCAACGGDETRALDAACGIELLHTYSLIHDDLPCMDDDDLRRGVPTSHKKFGEWRAVLAGDALQAAAFEKLLSSGLPPENVVQMGKILADAAGARGICGGQTLDMAGKPFSLAELTQIHALKTAALFAASAQIGVAAAGGTAERLDAAGEYARSLGMAFQLRDDALDVTAETGTLGKPAGSDAKNGRTTFASLFGVEACLRRASEETARAKNALKGAFPDARFLVWLAENLEKREA